MVERGGFLTETMRKKLAGFPTDADLVLAAPHFEIGPIGRSLIQRRSTPANKVAGGLQLGCLRMLGFVPEPISALPDELVEFVAHQLGHKPDVLGSYATRRQTRHGHQRDAEQALGFIRCGSKELKVLDDWLLEQALEHDRPIVLYRMACEFLLAEKLVRPAPTTIERAVITARTRATSETYFHLMPKLNDSQRSELDALCQVDADLGVSRLVWLRREASKGTGAAIAEQVNKIQWLKAAGADSADLERLNPNRVRHLAAVGKRLKPQAVLALQPERRYPILACTLAQLLSDRTDEVLDLFDMTLAKFDTEATAAHDQRLKQRGRVAGEAFNVVLQTHQVLTDPSVSDAGLRSALFDAVGIERFARVANIAADESMRTMGPQDLLVDKRRRVRAFVPAMMEAVTFQTIGPVAQARISDLRRVYASSNRLLPDDLGNEKFPAKWRRLIDESTGVTKRHVWEMATLYELRAGLRSADIWVDHSHRYQNPTRYLLPEQVWVQVREETSKLTGVNLDPRLQLSALQEELHTNLARLDEVINTDTYARIENGGIVNPSLDPLDDDPEFDALHDELVATLPLVSVVDLLVEVDSWCGFLNDFHHVDHAKPRGEDQREKLLATLIAIGCNIGTARVARFAGFSPEQLEWTANWYLRSDTVHKASSRIIRYQHALPLADHWGSGTLSSSDGQRFPVRVKTPRARHMSKYFTGTGATIYTWTSDRHTQFGTSLIPTTLREATYVLDAIFDNEHGLEIEEHTTDTAGYTDLVFGLFNLCGVTFSPRIKDIGAQRLWRMPDTQTGGVSAGQLRHTIDPQLIIDEWDNINKIAATIRHGHLPASTLITRLQASARQNRTTRAAQEYGRIGKTNSVLRQLYDRDHRRVIGTQLNKGESFHALRLQINFANRGVILLEDTEAQDTQAELVTMIGNAVNTWNTVYLAKAVDWYLGSGRQIDPSHLKRLSPILWEHINFQGSYNFANPVVPDVGQLRALRL